MRYIGNKEAIVSEIYALCEEKKLLNKHLSFFDAFCGTGSVANFLKDYFDTIIINDNLTWAGIYTYGRLCAQKCLFKNLTFNPFEYLNNNKKTLKAFFIIIIPRQTLFVCILRLRMQEELIFLENKLKNGI